MFTSIDTRCIPIVVYVDNLGDINVLNKYLRICPYHIVLHISSNNLGELVKNLVKRALIICYSVDCIKELAGLDNYGNIVVAYFSR